MILYLDTSALVKLVVDERGSDAVDALVATTEYAVSSVIAYAECRSAIARAGNARRVDAAAAVRSLDRVWDAVQTVDVDLRLSARAGELAGRHLLRGWTRCTSRVRSRWSRRSSPSRSRRSIGRSHGRPAPNDCRPRSPRRSYRPPSRTSGAGDHC